MQDIEALRQELDAGELRLLRFGDEELFASDRLDINWLVTMVCNYNCSYCFGHDNRRGFFPPKPMLMQAAESLIAMGRSCYNITITGGEPTLVPGLPALLSCLSEGLPEGSRVLVLSNFSRPTAFFRSLAHSLDASEKVVFSGTFHFERARRERFIENVNILNEHGFHVNFRILAHPCFMREVYDTYRIATAMAQGNKLLYVDVVPMREQNAQGEFSCIDSRYDRMALRWLQKQNEPQGDGGRILMEVERRCSGQTEQYHLNGRQVDFYELNRFRGMFCSVGRNSISIDPHGFVDPSVCFRSIEYKKPNLYLDPESLRMFRKPVVCPFASCACCVDQVLPKRSRLH